MERKYWKSQGNLSVRKMWGNHGYINKKLTSENSLMTWEMYDHREKEDYHKERDEQSDEGCSNVGLVWKISPTHIIKYPAGYAHFSILDIENVLNALCKVV